MAAPITRLREHHKLDPASLKAAFDATTMEKRPKVKQLFEEMRDSIRAGIDRNRNDYRLYKAMDWSYDQPFRQVAYTQLRGLIDSKPDQKAVMSMIQDWGLTHLLPTVTENGKPCCNGDGSEMKALNVPVFFNIFVPIVMAYITIRWAKLFNDRNLVPFFKYEPVQFTKENRVRCEVITQVVQRMSAWFDYPADSKQTILQTLLYGFCINFPREAWFSEKQEDEAGKVKIVREGLRFNMPHPSRVYYDLYHRLSSLNSNSGCTYAGYWELSRYLDVKNNKNYWNTDKIPFGGTGGFGSDWFNDGVRNSLSEIYPCTMSFPTPGSDSLDRESEAGYYGDGQGNSATLLTQDFRKIIPKDYGLGTYEHPVWFRSIMANDSAVIWSEPLAYDRFPTYAYDADFNRARFRSLALEVLPYQDQISNLLTNWIVSVKENLSTPIFYDKEMVRVEDMRALENLGHKKLDGRVFIPFSATQNRRMDKDQRQAFYTPQLTHHNTGELAQLISGVLSMLDRIMQLSPQEIGQPASHEQTAEESRIIAGNTSTRVIFTGTFIDSGDYAKKVMIYDGTMAYADEQVTVGISSSFASTQEEFDKLVKSVGLTIDDETTYNPQDPEQMITVSAKKSALIIESFVSTRDGNERIDNTAVATAMSQIFQAIANNPVLIQSVGPMQLVELLNQIIVASGMPKEFRLRGKNVEAAASPEEQGKEVQSLLVSFSEQVKKLVEDSQKQTLEAAAAQTSQIVGQAIQAAVQEIAQQMAPVAQQIAPLAEGVAQANETNQVQAVQINELGAAVKKLNDAIAMALLPPAPPAPAPTPQPILA